jgi:hypothetical protein
MKKKCLYNIIFFLGLYSCSGFLNQEPDLQISIDEQLSTEQGVLEAYAGVYRNVEAILSGNFASYADALGGNITFTPFGTQKNIIVPQNIENVYNFNANENELDFEDYYEDWYQIMNQINLILERSVDFSFLTEKELHQLKAELLTIRALAHYQVSLVFAQNYNFTADASHLGVVYVTKTLIAGVDFPARETMAATYILLQKDLDDALVLYNNTQLLSGLEKSYFNSMAAQALYARIALQMNDWQKAQEFSNTVITTSGISLLPKNTYISEWEKPVDAIRETILEFAAPTTTDGSVSSSIAASNFSYTDANNYADYVASIALLNLYEPQDIRANMFLEKPLNTNINGVLSPINYSFTKKFQDDAGTLYLRLSEMYLIRAEANARLNNNNLALNDLNIIRERANIAILNNTNNILENIFLERRKELAFEGHLLFDIARYQKDIERNSDCIAIVCNLKYPSNFYVLPIPFSSISLNQNIQQNEGY